MDTQAIIELFITARIADGRAQATIRDYRRVLDPFAAWCSSRGLAITCLARDDVRNLRAFLRWLADESYTSANLATAIKAPRRVNRRETPLTRLEITALLDACGHCAITGVSPKFAKLCARRDRAIILLLLDSGMRAGELLALCVSSWQKCQGHSTLSVYSSKVDRPRVAIIGKMATAAVMDYIRARGDDVPAGAPLLIGRSGKPLGYNGLLKILRRRAALAGLEPRRVHPHIFRKTFTTAFLDNGGDPERLRILAGWADYSMLAVYTESSAARLVEAHRRAGPVDHMELAQS